MMFEPRDWYAMKIVNDWWVVIHKNGVARRSMASLAMLVGWEG
jgi:hypothetical protein